MKNGEKACAFPPFGASRQAESLGPAIRVYFEPLVDELVAPEESGRMPSPFILVPDAAGLAVGLEELSSPFAVPPVSPDAPEEPVMPLLDEVLPDEAPVPLVDAPAALSCGRSASPFVEELESLVLGTPALGDAELSRPCAPPVVPVAPLLAPLDDAPDFILLVSEAPLLDELELPEPLSASAVVFSPSAPVEGRICSLEGRPAASFEPAPSPALCAWTLPKAIRRALERIAVLNLFISILLFVK